jgi:autotransporter-associated beta strand protein
MIFTHGSVTFSGNVGDGGSGYMLYLGSGNNWNTGGALTLSGSNTFTGGVLISQGTLLVASSAALGPPSNAVTLNDPPNTAIGTSQDPTNALGTTQDPWGYKSGAGETDQISALLIGGPYTVPNPIHVQAYGNGSYLGGNTASSATFSGPITLDQTTTLVAAPGGTIAFSNTISGAGGVVVGASGYTGTVILSGPNAYTGGTTLVSGGTLALGNSGALQQSTLDTSGNGVLSFGSLRSAMLGGLTGPGTLTLINTASAAVALSVGNNNNSTTFSGILQGAGSLTKIGSGTLTVTGNNAYSGGTSINAGSLIVAGSLAKTAVAVEGGASLGGTGTIGGSVTVAGGSGPSTWGTISLVDGAAGTLTLSDAISTDTVLTLGGGGGGSPSALDFEVGATADRILIAAGKLLVNSGGGVINVTPLAGFGPGTYDLMDFLSGQASGLGNLTLGTPTLPGYTLSLRSTPTAEQLVVQSVPEPSTLALLGAGAISLVAFAWRRRRQAS